MILTKIRQANPENILAYIQGNLRYKLFYSNFAFLIRLHIREQIEARIRSMDPECYNAGECKLCGCQTTALQMADKACDKPCYPKMMIKKQWNFFKDLSKKGYPVAITGNNLSVAKEDFFWKLENNKFIRS